MKEQSNPKTDSRRVAIIGTQGVPARYGGFESLVENLLGSKCPEEVEYTVFCSSRDMPEKLAEYKGARLKYVPLRANGALSVVYDALSLARSVKGYDTVLVLGVSGCWSLPIFRKMFNGKLIINIDGLEHRRDKWKPWVRRFLRYSEAKAVAYADIVISDNKGIQDYVTETYGRSSELIAYGGDHAERNVNQSRINDILKQYGVEAGKYAVGVCRIEPENNCRMVLEAFSGTDYPLLYIGNWNHSEYSRKLREEFSKFGNLHLADGVYDLDVLYALRSRAGLYVHGHSAGGTNPSLVEAMSLGVPIVAYDVVYNRETTENKAIYFKDTDSLIAVIDGNQFGDGDMMKEIASRRYTWDTVARQYTSLY